MNPVLAIELDDSSHYRKKAMKNDSFKNEFYKHINIPLRRVKRNNENIEDILDILNPNLVVKETSSSDEQNITIYYNANQEG